MEREQLLNMEPNMLLSIVNMKLRDEFSDLEDFCSYNDLRLEEVKEILEKIDYSYDREANQFKKI